MLQQFANRAYRRLYLAQIVALLGTGLATVALGLLAYDIAGVKAGQVLGTALAIKMIAYVFVAPLAAALLVWVSSSTLFFGTAVGFAASALLVVSVLIPHRAPAPPERVDDSFGARLGRGVALFLHRPALRPILALNFTVAAAGAFVIVQTVVVVRSVFELPEQAVAWVLAANGLGSMVAAFGLPRVLRAVPERNVMLGGAVVVTCATALIPLALAARTPTAGIAAVVAVWLAIGLGWSGVETPVGRVIRRNVDRSDLNAAFAAQFSLQHACWLLTYPLVGWLGAASLGVTAYVLAGIAAAATTVAFAAWPRAAVGAHAATAAPTGETPPMGT